MLQDKLNLNETMKKYGLKTCAEAFAHLKIMNGSRWAAIMIEQTKLKLPVWSDLDSMYSHFKVSYCTHGEWPIRSHRVSDKVRVVFNDDDIFPHDGSVGFVRYTKITITDDGKKEEIYKMKIGKAVRASLQGTKMLGEKALIYMSERATSEWNAKQMSENDYSLKIDEDFEFIYNYDNYAGHIASCQTDAGNYDFYKLIDGAKAASLLDENGKILCRAILFTAIHHRDDEDLVVRGIERMYSVDGRMDYKQIFLARLRDKHLIDIYKNFNAGAYDGFAWCKCDDDSSYRDDMYVNLVRPLEEDDPVSWMDTFYCTDGETRCCNYGFGKYEIRNSDDHVTWGTIIGSRCYDDFLEEFVECSEDDMYIVNYNGDWISVCESTRDEYFRYCDDEEEYCYHDDCEYSDKDDVYYHNAVWSEYYDSYIRESEAYRIKRADGSRDYVYEDDAYELEDGNYMLEEEIETEINGITYRAIGY